MQVATALDLVQRRENNGRAEISAAAIPSLLHTALELLAGEAATAVDAAAVRSVDGRGGSRTSGRTHSGNKLNCFNEPNESLV
jgi:hypothetical protein